MRTATLTLAVVCLMLTGATIAIAKDLSRFNPLEGVGGFTGLVEPIRQPVRVAWRPKSGIVGTVETLSILPDGQRESVVTTFTGAVTAAGGGVNRRFTVSELTINDQHVTADQPLVIVESWSNSQGGNVSDLRVTFPGFRALGIAPPTLGTPQHQIWVDLFAADLAYSDRPLDVGASVFETRSYRDLLEAQVRGIMGNPESEIVENTYVTIVKGVTMVSGRAHLVVELTGKLEARSGANRLIMEASGFGLIDAENGLSSGTSRMVVTAVQGGREARRTVVVDVQLLN
ncbi:MAG: hypothetical protein HQ495_06905 [Alphaproteobacteria bacterium]|nr:hypothetical protein [Alphaproteobacteria bacterium]